MYYEPLFTLATSKVLRILHNNNIVLLLGITMDNKVKLVVNYMHQLVPQQTAHSLLAWFRHELSKIQLVTK
jgi:hypothetical protein